MQRAMTTRSRRLKIAFLQKNLPPSGMGGVAYQVDLLAQSMVQRGHDLTVFTMGPAPRDASYRVTRLPQPRKHPASAIFGAGWAAREIELAKFDVVHAHGDAWAIPHGPVVRTFYGTAIREAIAATSVKRRL